MLLVFLFFTLSLSWDISNVDTTHADQDVAIFINDCNNAQFGANGRDAWLAYFSSDFVYIDGILGWSFNRAAVLAVPNRLYVDAAYSNVQRISGSFNSGAIVEFVNSADMFGGEIHAYGQVTFKRENDQWKIQRWIDHWDYRNFNNTWYLPYAIYPIPWDVRPDPVPYNGPKKSQIDRLFQFLSVGDVAGVTSLLSEYATFTDVALRGTISERSQLQEFFKRSITLAPYGKGVQVRHTTEYSVEWNGSGNVISGMAYIVFDTNNLIKHISFVWNSKLVADGIFKGMLGSLHTGQILSTTIGNAIVPNRPSRIDRPAQFGLYQLIQQGKTRTAHTK